MLCQQELNSDMCKLVIKLEKACMIMVLYFKLCSHFVRQVTHANITVSYVCDV